MAKTHITLSESAKLPGLLGKIVPVMLKAHGEYRCVVAGVRTLFVLRRESDYAE